MPDAYKTPAPQVARRKTKQAECRVIMPCGKPGAGKASWYWILETILKKREAQHD